MNNYFAFTSHSQGITFMTSFQSRMASALMLSLLMLSACSKDGKSDKDKAGKEAVAVVAATPGVKSSVTESNHEAGLQLTAEEIQTAGIQVAPLTEQEINEQIIVTATIQANQDKLAHIAPRVAGRVVRVMSNLGDQVKQGQALVMVDSIEVGEAQSAYAQALSEQALAKAGMERAEKLYADQIIPQKDFLRARADDEKAKAVLRAASDKRQMLGIAGQSHVSSKEASVFSVSAPFAGTIIEKKAVLGELATPDKELFGIADLSTVWIETNLYEKDVGKVKIGSPASVTIAAYPNAIFKGKITYISSVMDKESRTIKARVEVPNTDGRLKLEMFATAAISTTSTTKAMLLPETAVVLIQGQATTFVKEADGFEARAVDLGEKLNGQVILKAGIKPGEQLVTSGAYALKAKLLKSQIGAD